MPTVRFSALQFWKHHIQFKMAIIVILLTTFVLSGFGVYQYVTLKSRKISALYARTDTLIGRLGENLVAPLWEYDLDQVNKLLLAEMEDPNIVAILVKDPSQKIVAGKTRDAHWHIVDATDEMTGDAIVRTREIVKNDKRIGTISLYVTQRFVIEELTRDTIGLLVTIFILDCALFLALTIALRLLIIHPLSDILRLANAITAGDFRQDIVLRQHDEIGELANMFRTMKHTIEQVLHEISAIIQAVQGGDWRCAAMPGHLPAVGGIW